MNAATPMVGGFEFQTSYIYIIINKIRCPKLVPDTRDEFWTRDSYQETHLSCPKLSFRQQKSLILRDLTCTCVVSETFYP